MSDPIVVGIDGSDHSWHALDWGAYEAALRTAPLRLVITFSAWDRWSDAERRALEDACTETIDKASARVTAANPNLRVSTAVLTGDPAMTLLAEADHARMLVVGSRGLSRFANALIGSVATKLTAHAPCPVVVVRDPMGPTRDEIVVGVDGSTTSLGAVAFAFTEASMHGARLRAVHTWVAPSAPDTRTPWPPLTFNADRVQEEQTRMLAQSLAGQREDHPDVVAVQEVHRANPIDALARYSAEADLVVVGSRGRGGFAGLLLGSVSHGLLAHAHCPVAVVRPQR